MIASPSARAQASTAPAMIAGRAARTDTVHIARQRLTPSAAAPSFQPRGIGVQRVDGDRDHDRRDHHREDHDRDDQPRARELDHVLRPTTCAPRRDEVVADERGEHEDPDQPVDHRRHRGQQAHDRHHDAAQPSGRELDDEDRRPAARSPGRGRRRSRSSAACAQISGHAPERGSRRASGSAPELTMVAELLVDVAAGAVNHEQPVVRERRPRARGHEDDHQHDQQQHDRRQRAERPLGAPVRPRLVGAGRASP